MKRFRFDWCLNSCYTCQPIRALRGLTPFFFHVSSRCANISFTKNPEKYHKYRPEEVEEMIEKLFDTSAWAALWSAATRVPHAPWTHQLLYQHSASPLTAVALPVCDECFVQSYEHDVFM